MESVKMNQVIELVKQLMLDAENEITLSESKEQLKYSKLIQNQQDKDLLARMLDESSQIRDNQILSRRIKYLLDKYGVPRFLSITDQILMRLFSLFGYLVGPLAMPIFRKKLRMDTSAVIINEKKSVFFKHLAQRGKEKIGQNVNLLGEVVLGESEAEARYQHYLEALENPLINYISIKISGIYSHINPLDYEQNLLELADRLSAIYRQAMKYPVPDINGVIRPKFVNLDMEEYKDTHLTLDLFIHVLSLPEFKNLTAGIVVQAYLPDAEYFQNRLLDFAHQRVQDGGAQLKIRLVKGANLAMETVVSSLKGWENPIYSQKVDVDANYLYLLDKALLPENAKVMQVGVASHNLFSIAYAYLLAQKYDTLDSLSFEMLEGMANYLPRVLKALNKQIILYTPVVNDKNFLNAVAYLVRRLDENTGKENFLSYSFNLKYGSKAWDFLREQFEEAYNRKSSVRHRPLRQQNRLVPNVDNTVSEEFVNEPDTNFDLPQNMEWAKQIHQKWCKSEKDVPYEIPVRIADKAIFSGKKMAFKDHSQEDKIVVCEAYLADSAQVSAMIQLAEKDASGWSRLKPEARKAILFKTATKLSNHRGDLIGCMAAITGKTFQEGDVEVSEAIDFCRYYPLSLDQFYELENVIIRPKGVILVIPPWNFPTAIPVGGVAAALAGGNRVILKPATVAYPIAYEFAKCFWEAGVPGDALQIVCADGREPVKLLTTHPSIKHIIFTGGTDTAMKIIQQNPRCPVSAETGGKNAMILTASCDRDHAIQNILTSAFSNAGQKCSACSLLILVKEIYDDEQFREKLKDAVLSLKTGQVWDHGNIVGPMVSNVQDKLENAFKLGKGESWLVPPVYGDALKYVLKPTVKWGVKPGSYCFDNELFAPVLSVVKAKNFKDAVRIANLVEYGLTSGLQSLDEREHAYWKKHIQAGNLYINRGITGAIVSRQPFGGMKRSALGAGIKAGGPNYAVSFMDWFEVCPDLAERSKHCIQKFHAAIDNEFSLEKDIHNIHGEQNIFRYLPDEKMAFRICSYDDIDDVLFVLYSSHMAGMKMYISIDKEFPMFSSIKRVMPDGDFNHETDEEFMKKINKFEKVRFCTDEIGDEFFRKAAETGVYIICSKPVVEGRLELIHYFKEQSISYEYHRYGNIVK